MSWFVSFADSGAIMSTQGNATNVLIPHRCRKGIVKTDSSPLATIVLIADTIPVMGSTSRKLWIYRLYRGANMYQIYHR